MAAICDLRLSSRTEGLQFIACGPETDWLRKIQNIKPIAVGHRGSVLVDAAVLSNLKRYMPLAVCNGIDRFHLVFDVLDRAPPLGASTVYVKQEIREKLVEHKRFIANRGTDIPEVKDCRWQNKG